MHAITGNFIHTNVYNNPSYPTIKSRYLGVVKLAHRLHLMSYSHLGKEIYMPCMLWTTAAHTRTSMLRTLASKTSFQDPEWLLPETRKIFQKQAQRQQNILKCKRYSLAKFCGRTLWTIKLCNWVIQLKIYIFGFLRLFVTTRIMCYSGGREDEKE